MPRTNGKHVNRDFPAHMRPDRMLCTECHISGETIRLINGEVKYRLCAECLQAMVYDMVLNNDTISIANTHDALVCL